MSGKPAPQFIRLVALLLAGVCFVGLTSCEREQRSFRVPAAAADAPEGIQASDSVRPGGWEKGPPASPPESLSQLIREPYKATYPNNAQALSDGQTLFAAMNCSGCHANGGGGIGPPLIDPKWFYGGEPEQIYQSIVEGRPNGMPAFKGRIADYQVWELVAYVRSMSGYFGKSAGPGREEHMRVETPPASTPKEQMKQVPDAMTTPPPPTSQP